MISSFVLVVLRTRLLSMHHTDSRSTSSRYGDSSPQRWHSDSFIFVGRHDNSCCCEVVKETGIDRNRYQMSSLLVTMSLWWIWICSDSTETEAVKIEKCISKAGRVTPERKTYTGKRRRENMKIIKGSCRTCLLTKDQLIKPISWRNICKENRETFKLRDAELPTEAFQWQKQLKNLIKRAVWRCVWCFF